MSTWGVLSAGNHWTALENSQFNAWYVNFGSGNTNTTNKYNSYRVRPVAALDIKIAEGWVQAFEECCRNKMATLQCNLYRISAEDDLPVLITEVAERTYKPGTSICFVVAWPVLREIFAASFRDRIVQHWICIRLNPIFERIHHSLGNVCYNCRVGFGVHAAVQRIAEDILEVSDCYTTETYVGKIDIRSCFMNISKKILWKQLHKLIIEEYHGDDKDTLLWLTEVTLMHVPESDCEKRGRLDLWQYLDPRKSRFNSPPDRGMPIGNITSQLFCAFFLSSLDRIALRIVRRFRGKYVRFVDDMTIIGNRKEDVIGAITMIRLALKAELDMDLHPDKIYIQEARKGVTVIGSVIKPERIYTANRTVSSLKEHLKKMEATCRRITRLGLTLKRAQLLEHQAAGLNSYLGILQHSASYNIRLRMFSMLKEFWTYCFIVNGMVCKIKRKYQVKSILIREENEKNRLYRAEAAHHIAQCLQAAAHRRGVRHRKKRRRLRVQGSHPSARPQDLRGDSRHPDLGQIPS
ncbi:MAG: hypothetical protein IKK28_02085 [Mogibacterium sp.]|nr:hypothetical protein [Mogibacterium sp.]